MKNTQHFYKTEKEIINWLDKHNIKNYTLIPDEKYSFVINVDGTVNISAQQLKNIPVKFNIVNGSFYCSHNGLSSLNGCPNIVKGKFSCFGNSLKSLKGCPNTIEGYFNCSHNELTTLEGCPENIGGDFYCNYNKLKTLKFCPKKINGDFEHFQNKIKNYIFFPENVTGFIFSTNDLKYTFDEAYKIHLQDVIEYEKEILNKNIDTNKKDIKNISFKI